MYTKEQIENFIESQDDTNKDEWYATNRSFARGILSQFMEFCEVKAYQVLYKNSHGAYIVTSDKYATNAEFYEDYPTAKLIRMLRNEDDDKADQQ